MQVLTVLITSAIILNQIQACPESCCNDAAIFMLREDKCVFTRDNQKLAATILQEMALTDDNVFISPFSITNILQLLLLASKGETTELLTQALSAATVDIHEATRCITEKVLNSSDPTLNSTSDFFVNNEYQDKNQEYIRKAREYYGASFHNCNFERRPEKARRRINRIVAVKSNNLIQDLFRPGTIDNGTTSIVVNTITFRSNWKYQFDKELTYIGDFHADPITVMQTHLMRAEGEFYRNWLYDVVKSDSGESLPIEILDMPYESSQYSLMAIKFSGMDYHFEDLTYIERMVARVGILTMKSALERYPLEVTFPKFKMEYDRDLNGIFTPATGLGIVFSPRANYSNFVKDFYISNIIHKAAVVVTEEGTIASGASGGHFTQRQSQHMMFNTPFVFYIYHACDGLVLFQGRYAYPTGLPVDSPPFTNE